MPISDTTILRSVKKSGEVQPDCAVVRIVGIDEWAWRKGTTFGTVIVDLQRRQVLELLADRSAATTADWLKRHPEIEVVSRDRAGLYADAAREGAPQARQVADCFHLLKNLRETIERQLGRFEAPIRESPVQVEDDPDMREPVVIERSDGCSEVKTQDRLLRRGRDAARQAMFEEIRALYDAGHTVVEIARKLGLGPRRVYRWVRCIDVPERNAMAPKTCTPAYFEAFLARSWAEGTTKVRHLFSDIRHRGYTGSYSQLAGFVAAWRGNSPCGNSGEPSSLDQEAHAPPVMRTLDPEHDHDVRWFSDRGIRWTSRFRFPCSVEGMGSGSGKSSARSAARTRLAVSDAEDGRGGAQGRSVCRSDQGTARQYPSADLTTRPAAVIAARRS